MQRRSIFIAFSFFGATMGFAQITVDPFASITMCTVVPVDVTFTAVGVFDPGNDFTVELSDGTGSFTAPVVIGTQTGTTSGTISCVIPMGTTGVAFQVRVNSTSPVLVGDVNAQALTIEDPDAGTDGFATICAGNFYAAPFLGGTPDPGGMWSISTGTGVWAFADSFSGMMSGDVVQYAVTSAGGCTASAFITVSSVIPPNAGLSTTLTLCSTDAPINMWSVLNGAPDPGGVWTTPAGNPHPNTFDPIVDASGVYSYVVPGIAPCANAVASLSISVNAASNAGTDASLNWCTSNGVLDLFPQLGGGPMAGGIWTDDDATGQLAGSMFNAPGVAPGAYSFTYSVNGVLPCTVATATLTVTVAACLVAPPPQGNFATE